jgi:hypothetical protein
MRNSPIRNTLTIATLTAITLAVSLISGCGEGLKSRSIEIGGLLIRNQTAGPLYDIKLKVERTGTVVTCNFIPAGGDFSTEFPLRRYQGNSVRVRWQQNGQNFATGDLYAEIPDVLDLNSPAAAVVEIHPAGVAVVRLEQ